MTIGVAAALALLVMVVLLSQAGPTDESANDTAAAPSAANTVSGGAPADTRLGAPVDTGLADSRGTTVPEPSAGASPGTPAAEITADRVERSVEQQSAESGDMSTGTVRGRVVCAPSACYGDHAKGIAGAQVFIDGAGIREMTREDGSYELTDVPTGRQRVVAKMIGYACAQEPVTVQPNAATGVNLRLESAARGPSSPCGDFGQYRSRRPRPSPDLSTPTRAVRAFLAAVAARNTDLLHECLADSGEFEGYNYAKPSSDRWEELQRKYTGAVLGASSGPEAPNLAVVGVQPPRGAEDEDPFGIILVRESGKWRVFDRYPRWPATPQDIREWYGPRPP